jgi:sodium/proline symporter
LRVKTNKDYIIGGRGLGAFAGGLSAEAADMSAWLFMGLPGSIYLAGTGQMWIAVGLLIGTIFNWVFVAKRIRKRSIAADDSTTLPSFFANCVESRSKVEKNVLRVVASAVIALFFTVYVGSGFVAGGKFFSFVFGTPYIWSLVITAAVVIAYTFLGGFLAISWNSILQGVLMLVAVAAVPISALLVMGGLSEFAQSYQASAPAATGGTSWVEVVGSLSWGLGYLGMPHILIRYMAVKSEETVKKSGLIAIVWCAISLTCAVGIGFIGRAYLGADTLSKADSENLFTVLITKLFINGEFVRVSFVAGLFFCAILCAIMSTAAGQLLMASTSFSTDIYSDVINPKVSEKRKLLLSRVVVLVVALIGFLIALDQNGSIMSLVANAWAGFGAAFGPIVFLILFTKRVTALGAVAGMVAGAATVLLWPLLNTGLYELLPAFLVSLAVCAGASRLRQS